MLSRISLGNFPQRPVDARGYRDREEAALAYPQYLRVTRAALLHQTSTLNHKRRFPRGRGAGFARHDQTADGEERQHHEAGGAESIVRRLAGARFCESAQASPGEFPRGEAVMEILFFSCDRTHYSR